MRFTCEITPQPADIDELGHVNNAVWVRWLQHVATTHWQAAADPAHVDAYIWVVLRHEIDYLGNMTADEVAQGLRVRAETWVGDAPRGAKFDRFVEFFGADGQVKARARTVWAIIDRATGRAIRVPRDVAARFAPFTG
jgi:acyl-CoA thioester hydrolase